MRFTDLEPQDSAEGSARPPHLTDLEADAVRQALAQRRRAGGYEPGRWSVSSLNRRPEVLESPRDSVLPRSVRVRDITLRVVEQAPGVRLTAAGRRVLGDALITAGISSLEVSAHGWGVAPDELRASVRHWRTLREDLEVKLGATQTVEMVAEAADLGATVVTHWVPSLAELTPVYWPEAYRLAWDYGNWRDGSVPTSFPEALDTAGRVVIRARELGLKVGIGINLLSLASSEWLQEFAQGIVPLAPDEVWLSDGASGLAPEAWEYVVRLMRRSLPEALVSIYTKNAYGLGVANLVAAARAGATVLEASVNGFSMASGQPDLAQLVTSLEVLYGVATGIEMAALTQLSRLVSDLTGREVEGSRPVVGRDVHNWGGAEFISQERKLDPLIHWSYEPRIVGGEAAWDVTPLTGMWGMSDLATRLGLCLDREQLRALRLMVLNESAARRRALTDEEVKQLARIVTRPGGSGGPSQ